VSEMEATLRELVQAALPFADVPSKDASCHVGICPQTRCGHCTRIARLANAIDRAGKLP
jgi:hypothetical protein